MSSDQEASYYEIALTNRQVLTVFIVLLTCLVAAFLSGVWIGRGGGGGNVSAAIEQPLGDTEASQLAELNFFSDAPPLEAAPGTPSEPPASSETAPTAAPPPAAQPRRAEEPGPAQTGRTRSEPAPATKAPSKQAPSKQAPSRPASSGPVIQVFSTADAAQARRLVQRLGSGGYPAFLLEESLQGQTMYRVRVGPYGGETEAQRVADELRREFRLDTWITSQQPG